MKGCRLRITMPASTPLGQPCSSRPRRLPTSRRLPSPLRWIEGGRGPSSSDRVYPYFNRKKFNANQCASWSRGLLPAPRKIRKVRFATSQKTLQFQPDRNSVPNSRSPEVERKAAQRACARCTSRLRRCRASPQKARETRAFSPRQNEPEKFRDDVVGGGEELGSNILQVGPRDRAKLHAIQRLLPRLREGHGFRSARAAG
jgi:hypothetical protein